MAHIPDLKAAQDKAMAEAEAKVKATIQHAHDKWRQQFFQGFRVLTPKAFNDAELTAVAGVIGTKKSVSFPKVEGTERHTGNADACNYVLSHFEGASEEQIKNAKASLKLESQRRANRAEARAQGF